ncbi:hypothetical protein BDF19DRAFT_469114 [Syncephalis fuscata]|nr:hypothetical protein BDF19DRAFT_469114 [Syncephalis fuscata]
MSLDRRPSVHLVNRSHTFGDIPSTSTSPSSSSSTKRPTKHQKSKQVDKSTKDPLLSRNTDIITPISTQWNAADLHPGQALLTPSNPSNPPLSTTTTTTMTDTTTLTTMTLLPSLSNNQNTSIDPSGTWSLSRSLDNHTSNTRSHPMMISRSMGHQRHSSNSHKGSHGIYSTSHGQYTDHHPYRSHRFNSLDHKVDPDRLLGLSATHGLSDDGWLSMDGSRWIPPADTPSLTSPYHYMQHRVSGSIDDQYVPTTTTPTTMTTTMHSRHLLEGYNREIHSVLGGSFGTTIGHHHRYDSSIGSHSGSHMHRSLSEQLPITSNGINTITSTSLIGSLSTEALRKDKQQQQLINNEDEEDTMRSLLTGPLSDTYSPLTDTFSLHLSHSYDSNYNSQHPMGHHTMDSMNSHSTIESGSTEQPPPVSSQVSPPLGLKDGSSIVKNTPPLSTRKFMRRLSFINQQSPVRMGGGIMSLDTPLVTPGDDSFPQESYLKEEEEEEEIMDHSSTEGVFTFDKESTMTINHTETQLLRSDENYLATTPIIPIINMSLNNSPNNTQHSTSSSPSSFKDLIPPTNINISKWSAMTRSQLDIIEESEHSTSTTPNMEKRLALTMSDPTLFNNLASPTFVNTATAASSSINSPLVNYHPTSGNNNGMGVPLLAQLPLSAVGEMNNNGNEFPFNILPNELYEDKEEEEKEEEEVMDRIKKRVVYEKDEDDEDARSFTSPPCFAHQLSSPFMPTMDLFNSSRTISNSTHTYSEMTTEEEEEEEEEEKQHRSLFPISKSNHHNHIDHITDMNIGHVSNRTSSSNSSSLSMQSYDDNDAHRPLSVHSLEKSLFGEHHRNVSISGHHLHHPHQSPPVTSPLSHDEGESTRLPSERLDPIRFDLLTRISDQLYSQEMRNNFGAPTVLAVGEWLAIGTSSGMVVLYDHTQNLRTILRHTGVVTAVAVAANGFFVMAGFANGSIVIWDVRKSAIIRHIEPLPLQQHHRNNSGDYTGSGASSNGAQLLAYTAQRIMKLSSVVGRNTSNSNTGSSGGSHHQRSSSILTSRATIGHEWGSAILHVEFVGNQSHEIITTDDQGLVFLHRLAKVAVIRSVDTFHVLGRRRRNGPLSMTAQGMQPPRRAGTVFSVSSLSMGVIQHPADTFAFIAITTPVKMLIISTKPRIETHFKVMRSEKMMAQTIEEEGMMATCGCTAWYSATLDEGEAADPLLAYSWDHRLAVLRVIGDSVEEKERGGILRRQLPRITFVYVNEWRGPCPIVAIQWMTRKMLVLYTSEDEMLVFDRSANQVTERCDLRAVRLVKDIDENDEHSSDLELAYYQSVRSHKGRVYLLGVDRLWMGMPLSWADRIDACEQNGELLKAIDIGIALINGAPGLSTVGLPDDDLQRRVVVGARLMQLIRKATSITFAIDRVGERHPRSCRELARASIEASLCIGIESFLFDEIYETFCEHQCSHWFLGALAKAVHRRRIHLLPPVVAQDLIVYLRGQPKLLETILLHLDLTTLDIDTIVSVCRRDGLWDALIWVWTRAVHDWISPTVELLQVARQLAGNSERRVKEILDQLLAYFDHVLRGRWFPSLSDESSNNNDHSDQRRNRRHRPRRSSKSATRRYWDEKRDIIHDKVICHKAKASIYQFIFSSTAIYWPEQPAPGNPSSELVLVDGILKQSTGYEDLDDLQPYPYLSLLLDYDPKRWLDTLERAFNDDSYFDYKEPKNEANNDDEGENQEKSTAHTRQTIVDALIKCVSPYARNNFTTVPATFVCIFLARQLHQHSRHIQLTPDTLEAVLIRLTTDSTTALYGATSDTRQAAVQELLKVYISPHTKQMTELYDRAGFYRVLETVYRNEHNYGKVVETYLRDPERRSQVFDCIRRLLSDKSRSVEKSRLLQKKRAHVRTSVMGLMPQLVSVDGAQCARLVADLFEDQHEEVVKLLEPDRFLVYAYLHGLFEARQRVKRSLLRKKARQASDLASSSPTGMTVTTSTTTTTATTLISGQKNSHVLLDDFPGLPRMLERYIELLCERHPSLVRTFLADHEEDGIWLNSALTVCREYDVTDAIVWILEQRGDLVQALEAILIKVQDCVIQVTKQLARDAIDHFTDAAASVVSDWQHQHHHHGSIDLLGRYTPPPRLPMQTASTTTDVYRAVDAIVLYLRMAVELCERVSTRVLTAVANERAQLEHQSEDLWFMLLVQFVDAYRTLMAAATEHAPAPSLSSRSTSLIPPTQEPLDPSGQMIRGGLYESLTELLQATASSGVSLPKLLLRLVKSDADTNEEIADEEDDMYSNEAGTTTAMATPRLFADLRDVFFGMLDLYKFEAQLRRVAHRLIESDVFSEMRLAVHTRSHGWRAINGGDCDRCGRRLWLDARNPCARAPINAMQVFDSPLRWPHRPQQQQQQSSLSLSNTISRSTGVTARAQAKRAMSYDSRMHSHYSPANTSTLPTTSKDWAVMMYRCGHAFHQTCLLPTPPITTTANVPTSIPPPSISRQNSLTTSILTTHRLLSPPLSPSSSLQPQQPQHSYPISEHQSDEGEEVQLFSASSLPSAQSKMPCPVCYPPRILTHHRI